VIIVLCVVTFASIVPLFMFVGKNFLPVDDQSQFEVSVRAPEGYSLGATSLAMERVAAEIRKLPGITDTLATAGGGQDQVVNSGTIYVKLSDLGDRSESQRRAYEPDT
jgi:hydrophobic/amphiphilic exporter-1 (mainly G- bacteria), HAE1 family